MAAAKPARVFSFEFFPPNTVEGARKLRETTLQLAQLEPKFFSVTYGAGGSTRDRTFNAVAEIQAMGFAAAPHIACIGHAKAEIKAILQGYRDKGIRHLVALRGDPPGGTLAGGEFDHAGELVTLIREEFGAHFFVEVAAYPEYHPQSRNALEDLQNFRKKVEAGADSAITQYFFNADAYFHFVDQCGAMGVEIPIVPGIMPIVRFAQLARFSDACGAEIPRWMRRKLEAYGDDAASIRAFGLDVVTELCDRLLRGGAPGLHFYTLNQAGAVTTIWQRLGL